MENRNPAGALALIFLMGLLGGPLSAAPTFVEKKQKLDLAFAEIEKQAQNQRRLLGGLMTASGVFYSILAVSSPLIGSEYTQSRTPLLYGTLGVSLLGAGIYVFSSTSLHEDLAYDYRETFETRVEDYERRAIKGQVYLKRLASRSHWQRIFTSGLLILGGMGHLYAASATEAVPDRRGYIFSAGMAKAALGFSGMVLEKKMSGGFAVYAAGVSDLITEATDRNAPSTDYLRITGSLQICAGLFHILFKTLTEKEWTEFEENFSSPQIAVLPSSNGVFVQTQFSY